MRQGVLAEVPVDVACQPHFGLAVRGEQWSSDERSEFEAPIRAQYETQGEPYYATARLWDDGIIDPEQTRDTIGLALDVVARSTLPEPRFGLFRM